MATFDGINAEYIIENRQLRARAEKAERERDEAREALVEIRDNPYKGECDCGMIANEALDTARESGGDGE